MTIRQGLVVFGSFGFGNAGDEAVPESIRDMLDELDMRCEVHVLSRFSRTSLPSVIDLGEHDAERRRRLRGLPMIVCGGGSIEPAPISGLSRAMALRRELQPSRVMLLGASVEPGVHFGLRSRAQLAAALWRTGTVYARDRLSERTLKGVLPFASCETVGDLVLWMKPAETLGDGLGALPERYIACVLAPRWAQSARWTEWVVPELAALADRMNAAIVFVPMSTIHDDDRVEHARVAAVLAARFPRIQTRSLEATLGPREVCRILAGSVITVSMRLHGGVMAYAQDVPFVCIAYHPKILGFSETVAGLASALPPRGLLRQSEGQYGFAFDELGLKAGDLLTAAEAALGFERGRTMERLKGRLLSLLESLLRSDGARAR